MNRALTYGPMKTSQETRRVKYFCVPYIGSVSHIAQKKLYRLANRYCKTTIIRLAFRSFKVGRMLNVKDRTPSSLRSSVVYKFTCGSCNAVYIGETHRHLTTRIDEHLRKDRNSHIYMHINNDPNCKLLSDASCFQIIDHGTNNTNLRIKEAIHIVRERPDLNRQLRHEFLNLRV